MTAPLIPQHLEPAPPSAQVDQLVELSSRQHGHLCPGQVIGVRMAILGLGILGYGAPLTMPDIKKVVGFVEIERCLADAVAAASGLRFGRGSLKLVNLGLLAASFVELTSGRGVRLLSRESARGLARRYAPEAPNDHAAQTMAYKAMSNSELFELQMIQVDLAPHEWPGARPPKVACRACGVPVRAGQVRRIGGRDLCAVCAGQAYFTPLTEETR